MKPNGIKVRILVPLVLVLPALFGAVVVGAYQHLQREIDDTILRGLRAVNDLLQMELEKDAELISAALTVLKQDPRLQSAWLARDRTALLEFASPLFEELRREHRITHFYFHGPDGINFVRVHKPELPLQPAEVKQ